MFFIKLFNKLKGYVIITVEGFFVERFINICIRRHIYLWDIKNISKNKISVNLSVDAFRQISEIVRKSKVEIHITKKCGLPFFLNKYKKRKVFVFGIPFFVIVLFIMSRFVWIINVDGNQRLSDDEIIVDLKEAGLNTGMLRSDIDHEQIRYYIMKKRTDLSWIAINDKGVVVTVDLRERNVVPEKFDKYDAYDLIASKGGVVERVTVKNGDRLVSPGDVVEKGQVLASGVTGHTDEISFSNAEGEVIARTWTQTIKKLPYYKTEKIYSGKTKTKYSLNIFNIKIPMCLSPKIKFDLYDKKTEKISFSLGENFTLPFYISKEIYSDYKTEMVELNYDETKNVLEEELDLQYSDKEIISREFVNNNDEICITYELLENIAQKRKIEGEIINDNGKTP